MLKLNVQFWKVPLGIIGIPARSGVANSIVDCEAVDCWTVVGCWAMEVDCETMEVDCETMEVDCWTVDCWTVEVGLDELDCDAPRAATNTTDSFRFWSAV